MAVPGEPKTGAASHSRMWHLQTRLRRQTSTAGAHWLAWGRRLAVGGVPRPATAGCLSALAAAPPAFPPAPHSEAGDWDPATSSLPGPWLSTEVRGWQGARACPGWGPGVLRSQGQAPPGPHWPHPSCPLHAPPWQGRYLPPPPTSQWGPGGMAPLCRLNARLGALPKPSRHPRPPEPTAPTRLPVD